MNNVENILISLLRSCISEPDELNGLKINATESEFKELFELANKHSVCNIIANELFNQNLIPEINIKEAYYNSLVSSVMYYEKMQYEFQRICSWFEENCIMNIPLKGAVMRLYYKEPWLRTSCDIDILIQKEDLEKAAHILEEKGYALEVKDPHEWSFVAASGIKLELHFKLIETHAYEDGPTKYSWNVDCLSDVWESAVLVKDKKYQYEMSDELFYFYHIAHMAKHFENSGCGVRFFMDLWLLNHKKEYERQKREAVLKMSGLETFEKAVSDMAEVWFSETDAGDITIKLENFVFSSGIYGSMSNHTEIHQAKQGGRVRFVLGFIFLPYQSLKKKYPILDKHKWLYPFCQVWRWISVLSIKERKKSVAMTEMKNSIKQSSEDASQTGEMFCELGLINSK